MKASLLLIVLAVIFSVFVAAHDENAAFDHDSLTVERELALKPLTAAQKAEIGKRIKAQMAKQRGKPLTYAQKKKIEDDVRKMKKPLAKPVAKPVKKPVKLNYAPGSKTVKYTKPTGIMKSPGEKDTVAAKTNSAKETDMKEKGPMKVDANGMPIGKQDVWDDGYSDMPYKDSGYPEGEYDYQYDDVMSGSSGKKYNKPPLQKGNVRALRGNA